MSLKGFHVLFIILSVFLSGFFSYWLLGRYSFEEAGIYLIGAGGSAACGIILLAYLILVIQKFRTVG